MADKMKVEVWSDIMCPFCYIGKRNYEQGLNDFARKNDIELVWKSFQLDPYISLDPENRLDVFEYLSQHKGISKERVAQMHEQVTKSAEKAGLEYHLDKTVIANSFNAHRLIQFAKERGLGDEAEEHFFYANFTEGKDFGDPQVLEEIGKKIGLTDADVRESLTNEKYAAQVREDIRQAKEIGVTGVPFFVFNNKYAVSGAQPSESFTQVLEKSYTEWLHEAEAGKLKITDGPSCTPDGGCN